MSLPVCPVHGVDLKPAPGLPVKRPGVAGLFLYTCPVDGQQFTVERPTEAAG